MADYSKLTKRELVMTLYARDLMLENERKRLEYLPEKYFELKQQLHDLPKKIVEEVKDDLLDFSNGWWRYFMTDGCEYMLSSDLQGCLDEIIDTVLKKYGGEDE